jgi:sterol 3beta-glucosyltransferase
MAPTQEYPALIFYNAPHLGRRFNLATHKFFEQIMWSASKSSVSEFWKRKFGRLPKDFACPYPRQTTYRAPTVVSCSDYVFPRPADWPEHVHNTGYWFLEEGAGWSSPEDLQDFLSKGKAPVYVGFGSIGDAASAAQTTRLVVDALQRCGRRGVLATGWDGLAQIDRLPEDIFILESVPHSWLFPRMAAVVHHGGAGTTAAAMRAGVPSAVIPHTADQFTWGRRVYELGVGAKPLPRKRLSAEKLAQAIDAALASETRKKAGDLGRKIQCENGVQAAAKIIVDVIRISS